MPEESVIDDSPTESPHNPHTSDVVEYSSTFAAPPSPSLTFVTPSIDSPVDSSAEPEELTIKKGRGRPRADGLPNKTASMAPYPTPSPQYKRYGSDQVRSEQKPAAAFRWFKELPKNIQERLVPYVYRKWPVLLDPPVDDKGKKLDYVYIDKLETVPESVNFFRDKYGAGDYSLIVNDDVVDRRTIAEIDIKENFRDLSSFPPTDRRIDDVANVDLDDPANRSYVAYLRGKGKLPEQQQAKGREADMAEATAMKEMTSLVRDIIASKKDDRGTNDTTATVVKEIMGVMGEVNRQASSVMENAYKKTQDSSYQTSPPAQDPIDTLDKVLSVMDKIRPAASGDSEVIKLLLAQMNKRDERFEELMKEIKNGGQAQSQSQANPLSTTSDTIKTVVELVTTLGFKAPGAAASVVSEATGSWWKDNLPEIMQYGSQAVTAIAGAFTTKMQIDARMQQQQMQPPPSNQYYQPPQTQPQPQTLAPPVDPTIIQPEPIPQPELTPEQQQEMQDFYLFMQFIHEPLMNHIDQALGGDRFAEWLIDSKRDGAARYQQIKIAGPENMIAGLKMYQPLWMELEPKQSLLPQFIEEFMTMEERRAEEERLVQEEEEEEEGAATGD